MANGTIDLASINPTIGVPPPTAGLGDSPRGVSIDLGSPTGTTQPGNIAPPAGDVMGTLLQAAQNALAPAAAAALQRVPFVGQVIQNVQQQQVAAAVQRWIPLVLIGGLLYLLLRR